MSVILASYCISLLIDLYFFPSIFSELAEARLTCRWYASWILVCSFFPLVVMYFLWIYYTASGQLKDRPYIVANDNTGKDKNENVAENIADHYAEKEGLETMDKKDDSKKKENRDLEVGEP